MRKRHLFLKWILGPIVKLYIKEINGLHNFPQKGSFIMVSNYNSWADDVVIAYALLKKGQKEIGGLMALRPYKETLFNRLIINKIDTLSNFFFKLVSIYDGNPIENSIKALKGDSAFLIFPEGKQNYGNPNLLKAKTGAARIALRAKVPIIPMGIIGSEKVIPKNTFLPRFHRITINIGKPLHFKKFYYKKNNNNVIEKITKIFMQEIAKLCNKNYPF